MAIDKELIDKLLADYKGSRGPDWRARAAKTTDQSLGGAGDARRVCTGERTSFISLSNSRRTLYCAKEIRWKPSPLLEKTKDGLNRSRWLVSSKSKIIKSAPT